MRTFEMADFGGVFLTSPPVDAGDAVWPGINAYVQWFIPVNPRPVSIHAVLEINKHSI